LRTPAGRSGAENRADVPGILDILDQQIEIRVPERRGLRRRDDGEQVRRSRAAKPLPRTAFAGTTSVRDDSRSASVRTAGDASASSVTIEEFGRAVSLDKTSRMTCSPSSTHFRTCDARATTRSAPRPPGGAGCGAR
jgi:hypothetical protein